MFDIIIKGLYKFLSGVIGLLPVGSAFPQSVHSSFATLGDYFGIIDVFIPLTVLTWCVLAVFSVEIGLFAFRIMRWIISYVPFLKGKETI